MRFSKRNFYTKSYWLKKKRMLSQRKELKLSSGNGSSNRKKECDYKVVLKFIIPPTEEERIERQKRIAAVMIKNAIALAKKGVSLVDNRNVE